MKNNMERTAKMLDKISVKLISKPENILKTIYTACRTCYSANSPLDIFEVEKTEEQMLELIKKVIGSGHFSTIEHIQISFAISGISRSCSHQLVRHRHMSFSQKSQRYVKEKEQFDFVIPKSISENKDLKTEFIKHMKIVSDFYLKLTASGIKAEDARSILPNATVTSMVASLNLREMIHLANLRLCSRAQLEIRTLVKMMSEELITYEPWLKNYLVPKCERLGFCDEDKSCGRKPTLCLLEKTL